MMALALSGGKDSMACLFLMRERLDCAIYVDTGYAYPETREMINYASSLITVHVVKADRAAQNAAYGIPADVVPINWTAIGQRMTTPKPMMIQSYLQCCYENIAQPLYAKAHALGVTHLVTGQRHDEPHKSTSIDGSLVEGIVRVHPLEEWTAEQVLDYLHLQMEVPPHFYFAQSSLDCYDCPAYEQQSRDRVAWMQERYPDAYQAYLIRRAAVTTALTESLQEGCAV